MGNTRFEVVLRAASLSFLVHLFILLVGLGWKFHLVAELLFGLQAVASLGEDVKLAVVFDDFVTEEDFLDYLIIRSRVLEEIIVHFTASGWVNS